jgi:hypothetical protein
MPGGNLKLRLVGVTTDRDESVGKSHGILERYAESLFTSPER